MKRHLIITILAAGVLAVGVGSAQAQPRCGWLHVCPRMPVPLALITPQGAAIGGQWQRWVDESRVPTITGTLVFSDIADICGNDIGCSIPPPNAATWVAPNNPTSRDTLYFELGHQFDWRYLTTADRAYLAAAWGVPHWHWFDTPASLAVDHEDGLEADFAAIYQDCADGINDNGLGISLMEDDGPPQADPTINTCVYIDRIARTNVMPR